MLSREASFLLNNLLFLGLVFAIFWGTIFPLVSEAVQGTKITVGPPFFNQVAGPIMIVLLALMGVGPLMPWRKGARSSLVRLFGPPVAVRRCWSRSGRRRQGVRPAEGAGGVRGVRHS